MILRVMVLFTGYYLLVTGYWLLLVTTGYWLHQVIKARELKCD